MIRSEYGKRISLNLIGIALLMTIIGCAGLAAHVPDDLREQEPPQYEPQQPPIEQSHAIPDSQRRERLRQRANSSSERYELISIELDKRRK